jgi:hypothetical protein
MSARVCSSPLQPLVMLDSTDWSGQEWPGEDNLVDGWWTSWMLTAQRTSALSVPLLDRRSGIHTPIS